MKNYKSFLALVTLFFSISIINAQTWQTDLQTAEKMAEKNNVPIILVFQGSDWCAPCIKLDREIWSSDEFKAYSKAHYVMLKADFPRKKKNALSKEQQEKNNKLAEVYNPNGYFPFVVILDAQGKVLGNTGYKNISPKEYIEHLNSFKK